MTLVAGTRLGPYEILSPLGAGGMGEVYKARDTRLERTVAVKVLPQHMSASPEVRQRFEREAKTISQLSHAHICALYDVGREGDTEYLVMEYLEGETLSDRLAKGALPLEQTLRYGIEIAEALDKAHRQGIVHRDLKPGNVMITKSGVKLLDFGLAKAMAAPTPAGSLTSLPTQHGLTQEGTILGTFQYMAPEQLEGKDADARTDIFALGCVLYEMAAGRKAFSGASQASLISAIMKENPAPITSVQPMSPLALDRVVSTCLAKDPEERWQSAADVKRELRWIGEGSAASVPVASAPPRRRAAILPWLGLAAMAAVAAWLALAGSRRAPPTQTTFRSSVLLPERVSFRAVAVSPDGTRLVFDGVDETGGTGIWFRPLDSFRTERLAGSEHADLPFWSPDGRYLAFFADNKLKRIEASGGSPLALADVPTGVGGAWSPGGDILFAAPTGPIYRLSASGGGAVPVTKLDETRHETSHRYPSLLPDGKHFLFTALNLAGNPRDEADRLYVGSLDGAAARAVMPLSTNAVYSQGYLLYMRGGVASGTLLAQAFDAERFEIRGEPQVVAEAISANIGYFNFASFAVSANGVLVYDSTLLSTRLVWLDRGGKLVARFGETGRYAFPRISFDGTRIAFAMYDTGIDKEQIWIGDVERGTQTKLTGEPGENSSPAWSPDGSRIAFRSDRKHQADIFVRASSGSSPEEALSDEAGQKAPEDWSRDGQFLLYFDRPATGDRIPRLSVRSMTGDAKPFVFYEQIPEAGGGVGNVARFSPDGRWVALVSAESGRNEIYVLSFPDRKRKIQVSSAGGSSPRWRADGREIFFSAGGKLMAADVQSGADLRVGAPRPLFDLPGGSRAWDAAPDGQRFLVNAPVVESNSVPLSLIVNWTSRLKK